MKNSSLNYFCTSFVKNYKVGMSKCNRQDTELIFKITKIPAIRNFQFKLPDNIQPIIYQ